MLDVEKIRQDFPILKETVNQEQLVYLDNAATSQKPTAVLNAIQAYYTHDNANVHRGVHSLAERATASYEAAREKVQRFLNAKSFKEILFTRGTTTALNWVATGFGPQLVKAGDNIVITAMEHHSNIVPWQQLAKKTGAQLNIIELTSQGQLDMAQARELIGPATKLVAVAHVSNVLGVENPIVELTQLAHQNGALIVVDGAQAAPHLAIDVQALDVDFYAFSGHKLCGPTGIGVLYGKEAWLNELEPVEFGGEMIDFVYDDDSTWTELPWKFEAGTPNIAGAIGLGAAIDYLTALGMDNIANHQADLMNYVLPKLQAIDGITIYGPSDPAAHTGVISFNLAGIHPHDLATALDMEGVAVRAGHHCAQPLLRRLGTPATARASFYIYNTIGDCDSLVAAILATKEFFGHGTF